jgi:hypothetical protein
MQPPSAHSSLLEPKQELHELREPVVGLFSHPLHHSLSSFASHHQNHASQSNLAHQVSEPELVGVKTTISPLNSLAGMI